jgi:hypothetical protein
MTEVIKTEAIPETEETEVQVGTETGELPSQRMETEIGIQRSEKERHIQDGQ